MIKRRGTCSVTRFFVPHDRASWIKQKLGRDVDPMTVEDIAEDALLVVLWKCVLHQFLGWPLYILDNLGGQEGRHGFPYSSHYWFREDSQIYKQDQLPLVFWSDLGVLLMSVVLYQSVQVYGWWAVGVFYGLPYLWLNHWIVLITFLQHADGRLPHFAHSRWTLVRGAAATIDRDFGFIDTQLFPHIVETPALQPPGLVDPLLLRPGSHRGDQEGHEKVMGKHYHEDRKTSILSASWRNQRDYNFVEETGGMEGSGVFMFRNLHGSDGAGKTLGNSSNSGRERRSEQRLLLGVWSAFRWSKGAAC